MRGRFSRFVIGAVWLVAVGIGLAIMMNYETAAGRTGETPDVWPADASFQFDSTRPTLVLFAHPKCPCTRAGLRGLNRLLAQHSPRPATHIFFLKPEGTDEDWVHSDLWREAAAIPELILHIDDAGREAKRFGVQTSGHVVMYDAGGQLRFSGGITAARGQERDNASRDQLRSCLMAQEGLTPLHTPVYGCPLRNDGELAAN